MHGILSQTRIVMVAALLLVGVVAVPAAATAQDASAGADIVVGIYDPQRVAEGTGLQQEVMEKMQGLQQRAQQAQQDSDQEAMQQIQLEAQQLQQQAASDFAAGLEAVMASVAESAGVQIITTDVSWAAPGVSTQDVTDAIIAALAAAEDAG